jgi:hypothetical protein
MLAAAVFASVGVLIARYPREWNAWYLQFWFTPVFGSKQPEVDPEETPFGRWILSDFSTNLTMAGGVAAAIVGGIMIIAVLFYG